jgi:hypothetical protein
VSRPTCYRLFTELLDNVHQHASQNTVRLDAVRDGRDVRLTFTNSLPVVHPPLILAHLKIQAQTRSTGTRFLAGALAREGGGFQMSTDSRQFRVEVRLPLWAGQQRAEVKAD